MSEQEENRWIAERVMRWKTSKNQYDKQLLGVYWEDEKGIQAYLIKDFNPATDLNHAEKALVQWKSTDVDYMAILRLTNKGWRVKLIRYNAHYPQTELAKAFNKSLAAAITEALCMATGKEVSG